MLVKYLRGDISSVSARLAIQSMLLTKNLGMFYSTHSMLCHGFSRQRFYVQLMSSICMYEKEQFSLRRLS